MCILFEAVINNFAHEMRGCPLVHEKTVLVDNLICFQEKIASKPLSCTLIGIARLSLAANNMRTEIDINPNSLLLCIMKSYQWNRNVVSALF